MTSACSQLQQDIANYQAQLNLLNRKLTVTEGFDARKVILDEIAITARVLEDTEANYARNCPRGPISPAPFQSGAWTLQSPFGIRLSDDVWQTGSVWAVHPLPGERMLIGTEQGGLWLSEPDGAGSFKSRCLSDSWNHWGFSAFAADPADPDRIFAGVNDTFANNVPGIDGSSGGVYVGRASRPDDPWTYVPLPPRTTGGVLSMIIVPGLRRLVVAIGVSFGGNANPLCWMSIDSAPFVFQVDSQTATDLANASGDLFLITDQKRSLLGVGQFSGSTIAFNPVGAGAIQWSSTPRSFSPMRVASCKVTPNNAYCLGFIANPQRLFIIRSADGGTSWTECTYSEPNTTVPFGAALDAFDSGVKSRYSIAVHPTDPLTVAAGYGAVALSNDGGSKQWLALNNAGANPAVPMHADIHELCFDEATGTLLIPSDGGLLTLPSLAALINMPLPFGFSASYFPGDTRRNRTLPVVMLDASPPRQTLANVATGGGIVVTGTQDNANLWLDPATQIWNALEVKYDVNTGAPVSTSGDGGVVAISAQASGTYVLHGENSGSDNVPVQWARWQGGGWGPSTTVPAPGSATGLIPILRPVSPAVGLFAPFPAIAIASPTNNIVFGAVIYAFPSLSPFLSIPTRVLWAPLGALPATEIISALEAFDSSSVLAGTQSGRLFRVSLNGTVSEIFFDESVTGLVAGIASDGNMVVCSNQHNGTYYVYAGQPVSVTGPQRLSRISTVAFPPNGGTRFFRSICANRNSRFLRFTFAIAIDENEVWVSDSPLAAVWHKVVGGLPIAVRCSDLVFSESSSEGQLFLSTYGRGLWKLAF